MATSTLKRVLLWQPEAFYLDPVSGDAAGVCIGSYTFNTPGVYTYDCSIGSHAALGMVATITVGTGGAPTQLLPTTTMRLTSTTDLVWWLNSPQSRTSSKDKKQVSMQTLLLSLEASLPESTEAQ